MKHLSRKKVRNTLKSHLPVGVRLKDDNSDVIAYLAYLVFVQRLADESRVQMQLEGLGAQSVSRRHVTNAGNLVLERQRRHRQAFVSRT